MWFKNLIDSLNSAKNPFDRFLLRCILVLIIIGLTFLIGLIGYSLLNGKHIKVASKDYGIESTPNIVKPDTPKLLPSKKIMEVPIKEKFIKNVAAKPATIQAKNVLNGNVSGGNVQIGDNNIIQREQRTLDDNLKVRLLNKVDSVISINNLPKNIRIGLSFPMSSEEAQRYAIEIGEFLLHKGYYVSNVGPSLGNEPLGFIVRYVNEAIQVEVGLKNIGKGKL